MNPETPPERQLQQAVDLLEKGGLLIYPTDTVYALGCDIANKAAVERVCRLKEVDCKKHRFACIVPDMKTLGQYTVQVDTATFKLVNRLLPGPYTLILNASNQIPRHFLNKRREVGLRIPDHAIPQELVRRLGRPLLTTSLRHEDEILEYRTDPELIHERFEKVVEAVIAGGYGGNVASTVLDLTGGVDAVEVIREGKGSLDFLETA